MYLRHNSSCLRTLGGDNHILYEIQTTEEDTSLGYRETRSCWTEGEYSQLYFKIIMYSTFSDRQNNVFKSVLGFTIYHVELNGLRVQYGGLAKCIASTC